MELGRRKLNSARSYDLRDPDRVDVGFRKFPICKSHSVQLGKTGVHVWVGRSGRAGGAKLWRHSYAVMHNIFRKRGSSGSEQQVLRSSDVMAWSEPGKGSRCISLLRWRPSGSQVAPSHTCKVRSNPVTQLYVRRGYEWRKHCEADCILSFIDSKSETSHYANILRSEWMWSAPPTVPFALESSNCLHTVK